MKTNLKQTLKKLYEINNSLRNQYTGLYVASVGPEYKYT